ncbi:MAG: hypothetical protein EPN22_09640 [Nitrospirae bacterium]|nr:MAG: hypothetical protein EPN22_09640 [Nitrospirota bacterium]
MNRSLGLPKKAAYMLFYIACGLVLALFSGSEISASNMNHLAEGNRLKGVGDCSGAVEKYRLAKQQRQFREEWGFYHAAADCYAALRDYDKAIVSYGKVIESTKNRALQGEMYRGRGKAYYLKAKGKTLDGHYVDLAYKNLAEAKARAVDVADIEREISADIDRLGAAVTGEPRNAAEEERKIDEKMQEYLNRVPQPPVQEVPVVVKPEVKETEKTEKPSKKKTIKKPLKKGSLKKAPVKKGAAPDNSSSKHRKLSDLHKGKTDKDGASSGELPFKDIFQKYGEGKAPPKKQKRAAAVDKDTTSEELEKLLKEVVGK